MSRTVRVEEYTRADGTKVEEHDRTIRQRASDLVRNDDGDVHGWMQVAGTLAAGYLAVRGVNMMNARVVRGGWSDIPTRLQRDGYQRYTRMTDNIPSPETATPGWFTPDAYRHLQGGSRAETLSRVESAIKNMPVEHSFVIDRRGRILAGYRGTTNNTPMVIPEYVVGNSSRGLTVTHNHPLNTPYSGGDLLAQYQLKIGTLRAVEPSGAVTQMRYNAHRDVLGTRNSTRREINRNFEFQGDLVARMGEREYLANASRYFDPRRMENMSNSDFVDWVTRESARNAVNNNAAYRSAIAESYERLSRGTRGVFQYEELGRIVKRVHDDLLIEGEIAKLDEDQRQVFGWASITEVNGEPVVDLQGDVIDTYELEKAAYDYVLNSRVGGEMHQRVGKSSPKQVGTLIESMVLTPEKIEKMGLPDDTPRGWWIGFQVAKDETGDEAWDAVKKGKYTGFSIHGLGKRKRMDTLSKALLERSPEELQGWFKRVGGQIGVPPHELAADLANFLDETGAEGTDEEIHDFIMQSYGSDDVEKKIQVEAHTRNGINIPAHERSRRGGSSGDSNTAARVAGGVAGAAGIAAAATPWGRRMLRNRRAYGQGSATPFAAGRELPSGPARQFGTGRDFVQGMQGNFQPYSPSRMFQAGDQIRGVPGAAANRFAGPIGFAQDVGQFAGGVGRGVGAASREAANQATRRASFYTNQGARRMNEAMWRSYAQDPRRFQNRLEIAGLVGGAGLGVGTAYAIDAGLQRAIPQYGEAVDENRRQAAIRAQNRRERRQETFGNMQENIRRRLGLSEGEPARVSTRKQYKEDIDKHLIGRHNQKDHGNRNHSRSDHGEKNDPYRLSPEEAGIRGAIGIGGFPIGAPLIASAFAGTPVFGTQGRADRVVGNQKREAERHREKAVDELAWARLVEEVGESEAARAGRKTLDRFSEIRREVKNNLGPSQPSTREELERMLPTDWSVEGRIADYANEGIDRLAERSQQAGSSFGPSQTSVRDSLDRIQPTDWNVEDKVADYANRGIDRLAERREEARKRFLVAKAAERSSSAEEFAENIAEIAKALEDRSPSDAAYFDEVHKRLIGRHNQTERLRQREKGVEKRQLTKREKDLLEKYLGPIERGDEK